MGTQAELFGEISNPERKSDSDVSEGKHTCGLYRASSMIRSGFAILQCWVDGQFPPVLTCARVQRVLVHAAKSAEGDGGRDAGGATHGDDVPRAQQPRQHDGDEAAGHEAAVVRGVDHHRLGRAQPQGTAEAVGVGLKRERG